MANTRLHIDYESRSRADLREVGTVRYAKDRSTRILMCAWAVNDEPVQQWFPLWEPIPPRLEQMFDDPDVTVHAQNYRFERLMTLYRLKRDIPISRWRDTMISAYRLSLPGNLEELGEAIDVEGAKKDKRGSRLIQLFCTPRTSAQIAKNPKWIFNDWKTHPAEWKEFCAYNIQDVEAERKIYRILKKFYVPEIEDEIWQMDELVNDRGMPIDVEFVTQAANMVERIKSKYLARMSEITGCENPNSGTQLLPWLAEHGYPFDNLKKASVVAAAKDFDLGPEANEVIKLRLEVSKTSCDKYRQMLQIEDDGYLRYCFQYGGAQRTLRWAGRKPQLQNLPSRFEKKWSKNLDEVRNIIASGDEEWLELMWGDPLAALSACVRTAIVAPKGKVVCCADLSSIESRGIAHLAKCKKMISVFENNMDMYKSFGSGLFKKDYDDITKDERDFCKPPVLGSGFGLGAGEVFGEYPLEVRSGLIRYAHDMGVELSKSEAQRMTDFFRAEYIEVVQAWYALENAAVKCIQTKQKQRVVANYKVGGSYKNFPLDITFEMDRPFLKMALPSGRFIYYLRPRIKEVTMHSKRTGKDYTKHEISYEGYNDKKVWTRIKTYGGKFIENLVQAWARDIMAVGMLRAVKRGFMLLGSVHDELITLVNADKADAAVKILCGSMTESPEWYDGVQLKAEGFHSPYYRKN